MPSSASLTALFSAFRFLRQPAVFRSTISTLSAIIGVFLSDSSQFEASSAMFWALTILLIILIIYANATLVIMLSLLFRSITDLLRFIAQHVAFGVFMSTLFDFIGPCFPDSSLFQEISIRLWVVILCLFIYNADEVMPPLQFTSITNLLRFNIPQHEGFGNLIQELTSMVQRCFPNSSPLEENSIRTWTLIASRSIYRYTNDVISGSLACAVLISFIISRHETPIYIFFIWAICVISYLKNSGAAIIGIDNDSTAENDSTSDNDSTTDSDILQGPEIL